MQICHLDFWWVGSLSIFPCSLVGHLTTQLLFLTINCHQITAKRLRLPSRTRSCSRAANPLELDVTRPTAAMATSQEYAANVPLLLGNRRSKKLPCPWRSEFLFGTYWGIAYHLGRRWSRDTTRGMGCALCVRSQRRGPTSSSLSRRQGFFGVLSMGL